MMNMGGSGVARNKAKTCATGEVNTDSTNLEVAFESSDPPSSDSDGQKEVHATRYFQW